MNTHSVRALRYPDQPRLEVNPSKLGGSGSRHSGTSWLQPGLPIVFLPILLLVAGPTLAGETPWQEIAPDVRVRLISSDTMKSDGTMLVGLEIAMPATTRTYWRVPGETGIPTELDLSASQGISLTSVHWPFPTIETSTGYLDYAYFGPTVVPFTVSLESEHAGTLAVSALMGICLDICVPASADFSLPLDRTPDPGQAVRLSQAMASVPIAWPDESAAFGTVTYAASEKLLQVEVIDPSVDVDTIIADVGAADVLFGAPVAGPDGRTVSMPLLMASKTGGFNGGQVRLTFMTQDGPYELWLEAAPASDVK